MFEDTTDALPVAEVEKQLQTLTTRVVELPRVLRRTGMLTQASELVEDAHRLAGGAGMFGFLQVAAARASSAVSIERSIPIIRQEHCTAATIAR